jgi:hypothetical protein
MPQNIFGFLACFLTLCCVVLSGNDAVAQEKRWKDVGPVELPDSFRTDWQVTRLFVYESDGFLPGEGANAGLSTHKTADGLKPHVVVTARIDIPGTFPSRKIRNFVDMGFCELVDGRCKNYRWITDTLDAFLSEASHLEHDGTALKPVVTLREFCFDSIEALNSFDFKKCRHLRMNLIAIGGSIPLNEFLGAADSLDDTTRRFVLRFYGDDKKFAYVSFYTNDLLEKLSQFAR